MNPSNTHLSFFLLLVCASLTVFGCGGNNTDGTQVDADTVGDTDNTDDLISTPIAPCVDDAGCSEQAGELGPCETMMCNTETGECEKKPVTDGTSCDSGNRCLEAGSCSEGECTTLGTAINCDDNDECTTDACDPATGCINSPIDNCCTKTEDCASSDPCVEASCENNECTTQPIANCCADNSECDDEDECTNDKCENNVCIHESIADCGSCTDNAQCDDQNECTADQCMETGACVNVPIEDCCVDSSGCDDQDECTTDVCTDKKCTYSAIPGCGDNCQNATDCDDQDPCTVDLCQLGECKSYETANCCIQDSECNDNDTCTDDTCENGSCFYASNGSCADEQFIFCTLTGTTGAESTCDIQFAAVSTDSEDQLGGFQVSIMHDSAKAEFTGFSCPPGNCSGLEGGTLATTHLVTGNQKSLGEYMMISFSMTAPGPYTTAVYDGSQFVGSTYVMTMHFTHLTDSTVDIEGHDFVGSTSVGQALTVQVIDGVLVSSKK